MEFWIWAIAAGVIFIFGSCFGSFLNVVVYRLPEGLSLIHPPSRCPKCGHRLTARENIPVFGWLFLRGKCRWCKTPIPIRYPLVETFVGLLFVAVFFRFGVNLEAIAAAVLLFWLTSLALIDFDTFTLPNSLTQSGLVLGLIFQILLGVQTNGLTGGIDYFTRAIAAMVLGIWLLDIVRFIGTITLGQEAMGGGDPKLLAMIGVWLGWQNVILTLFLSCAVGTIIVGIAMQLGKHQQKQHLPFGPFLALGAMMSLFFGDTIIDWYFNQFFTF